MSDTAPQTKDTVEEEILLPDFIVSVTPTLKDFVSECMGSFQCPAHDLDHCFRVARLAAVIATKKREEEDSGTGARVVDVRTAFIAGLIHDVFDSKFSSTEAAAISESRLNEILLTEPGMDAAKVEIVIKVARSVGYKNLIRPDWDISNFPAEYRCVQDADLLDAIGAVGVARSFAYGGRRNRLLFGGWENLSTSVTVHANEYNTKAGTSSLEHFFEKLLRLKSLMLTRHGKHLAERRHSFMVRFLMELGLDIGGVEGTSLRKRCEEEDDTRLAYESIHNGVILCLLDEELGKKITVSQEVGLPDLRAKEQPAQLQNQCVSDEDFAEAERQRFAKMFRTGWVGLIVESLELDRWL